MWTLEDQIRYEGETLGETRGIIEMGWDMGASDQQIVTSLMRRWNLTEEEAREALAEYGAAEENAVV